MPRTLVAILLSLAVASTAFAMTQPLEVDVSEPETIDASHRIQWRATVTNNDVASVEVRAYIWPSAGQQTFVQAPERCVLASANQMNCVVTLAPQSSHAFDFTTQADRGIGTFGMSIDASASAGKNRALEHETTVFGIPYLVTTVDDSGPGSLRQAITDINRDCRAPIGPCSVTFGIDGPVPATGYFTIHLKKALPEIAGLAFSVDGRSQARHTGNTNPSGPEILLDGTEVSAGHGLALRNSSGDVRDLAIGGFPENGIDFVGYGLLDLRRVYLGVDATGMAALGNGYRGVQATDAWIIVKDSILSGNGRAGGWFWTAETVTVESNMVGVGADGVTPIGNGASGLFFHNPRLSYRYAVARDNIIANNRHAGIGLSYLGVGHFAENVMRNNANGAIDIALDGPTLATVKGNPGQGGIQGPPVILSAKYENGVTTIEGRKNTPAGWTRMGEQIYVFANRSLDPSGAGEAEELIGVLQNVPAETFTLRVNADLRGRYVTASHFVLYIYNWDFPAPGTSEVGLPKLVE
jgi:hypothetical protein